MKFLVTFKTPNAVEGAIKEYLDEDSEAESYPDGTEEFVMYKGRLNECHSKVAACLKVAETFCTWGEVVTIEFDSEKMTATVIPARFAP